MARMLSQLIKGIKSASPDDSAFVYLAKAYASRHATMAMNNPVSFLVTCRGTLPRDYVHAEIIIIIIIIITRRRVEKPLCCNVTYQLFT
jgi:hypothetical protein